MKSTRLFAAAVAVSAGLSLAACSSDDDDSNGSDNAAVTTTAAENTQEIQPPTAQELQDILDRAVDPAVPAEEKTDSVEGGEEAVELFDVMTRSKEESGATLQVVDPVLPGISPQQVMATLQMEVPDLDLNPVEGVGFVYDDGQWKLERRWACTLVNTVAADQLPPLCEDVAAEQDAPAEDAPEDAPAEDAPEDAPAN